MLAHQQAVANASASAASATSAAAKAAETVPHEHERSSELVQLARRIDALLTPEQPQINPS